MTYSNSAKKLISWLLALVMIIGVMSGFETETYAAGSNTEWKSALDLPDASGKYSLTTSVALSSDWIISKDTEISLNLNGYIINLNGYSVINNGVLNIADSSTYYGDAEITYFKYRENAPWEITSATTAAYRLNYLSYYVNYLGIIPDENTVISYEGGLICGGSESSIINNGTISHEAGALIGLGASASGGAVTVCSGSAYNLSGGHIAGCSAKYGGAVYVCSSGSFSMTNSLIHFNCADEGGAVQNLGTFVMSSGSIYNNSAKTAGGGVHNLGTFVMAGGGIGCNKAKLGGGVLNRRTMIITEDSYSPSVTDNEDLACETSNLAILSAEYASSLGEGSGLIEIAEAFDISMEYNPQIGITIIDDNNGTATKGAFSASTDKAGVERRFFSDNSLYEASHSTGNYLELTELPGLHDSLSEDSLDRYSYTIGETYNVGSSRHDEVYEFAGWYEDENYTGSPMEGQNLEPGSDYYARWVIQDSNLTIVTKALDFTNPSVSIPSGSGISWNSTAKVLTLGGVFIDCSFATDTDFTAVKLPADSVINVPEGKDSIVISADTVSGSAVYGIECEGTLTVTGAGILYVFGGECTDSDNAHFTSIGISAASVVLESPANLCAEGCTKAIEGVLKVKGGRVYTSYDEGTTCTTAGISIDNNTGLVSYSSPCEGCPAYIQAGYTAYFYSGFDSYNLNPITMDNYKSFCASQNTHASSCGYTFDGWYEGASGYGEKLAGEAIVGNSYYAKWVKNEYTVLTDGLPTLDGCYMMDSDINEVFWSIGDYFGQEEAYVTLNLNGKTLTLEDEIQLQSGELLICSSESNGKVCSRGENVIEACRGTSLSAIGISIESLCGTGTGIYLERNNKALIQNCVISNCSYGIFGSSGCMAEVIHPVINNCSEGGIYFLGEKVEITSPDINDCNGCGIYCGSNGYGADCTAKITAAVINNCGCGIEAAGGDVEIIGADIKNCSIGVNADSYSLNSLTLGGGVQIFNNALNVILSEPITISSSNPPESSMRVGVSFGSDWENEFADGDIITIGGGENYAVNFFSDVKEYYLSVSENELVWNKRIQKQPNDEIYGTTYGAFVVDEYGFEESPMSVEYNWYSNAAYIVGDIDNTNISSDSSCSAIYDNVANTWSVSEGAIYYNGLDLDENEKYAFYFNNLSENATITIQAHATDTNLEPLTFFFNLVKAEDGGGVSVWSTQSGDGSAEFQPGTGGKFYIGGGVGYYDEDDREMVKAGTLVFDNISVYTPDLSSTVSGQNSAELDIENVPKGYYTCVADFKNGSNTEFSFTSAAVLVTEYAIYFETYGGTPIPAEQTVRRGKNVATITNLTRGSSEFEGWYPSPDYDYEYDFAEMVTCNLTLFAKWTMPADGSEVSVVTDPNGTQAIIQQLGNSGINVSGLDAFAAELKADSSNADKDVKVVLTAENETSSAFVNGAEAFEIKASAGAAETLKFFNISLDKYVSSGGVYSGAAEITEASIVFELTIPFEVDNLDEIHLYRYHNGAVEEFTYDDWYTDDGFFWYDESEKLLHIHTSKFSTYAVGYTTIHVPVYEPEYLISGADTENGKITVSKKYACYTDTVTLTVTPDAGYKLGTLSAVTSTGRNIKLKQTGNNTYSFTMPSLPVTVDAEFALDIASCPKDSSCPAVAFTDLDLSLWYHDGIHYCVEQGYMNGVSADGKLFNPSGDSTRAMIVTMLWRYAGCPQADSIIPFDDVDEDAWYAEAVRWAAAEGIIKGYDGKFNPAGVITREQLATVIYSYEQKINKGGFTGEWMFNLDYPDADQISDWASEAMHWVVMKGIVNGKNGLLDPKGNASRAEMAVMMQRYCTAN